MCSNGRVPPNSRVRAESGTACAAAAGARPRGARAGGGGGAAPRAGDRGSGGSGREAGDAPRRGARHVPVACPRRPRPGCGRAGVGGRPARLEDTGFAVDPVEQGAVVFETRGVERLYGGVQPALERALAAVGPTWDPASAPPRVASPRSRRRASRGPVRSSWSRRRRKRRSSSRSRSRCSDGAESLRGARGLGLRSLGELRGFPVARSRSGWGWRGRSRGGSPRAAARRACGDASRPGARRGSHLPEAIANEITLRRALGSLLERLLARPERAGRTFRKLALVARLSTADRGGAS